MKWELWKDQQGHGQYIIAQPCADSLRKRLPENSKVVWSCEAYSPYDAQYQYLKYQRAWFRLLLFRVNKMLKPEDLNDKTKSKIMFTIPSIKLKIPNANKVPS